MPEEIKETAILFFFQELKQKEIADLLKKGMKEWKPAVKVGFFCRNKKKTVV